MLLIYNYKPLPFYISLSIKADLYNSNRTDLDLVHDE